MHAPSVAIVTGASSGLGRSFALELSRMGTAVVAVARRERELEETAALIANEGGNCEIIVADVTAPGSADDAVARAEATFGPVDLLVSNAGAVGFAFVEHSHPDVWRTCFEVNVVAPMQWAKAVVPSMRERKRGRIINISSLAMPVPGSAECPDPRRHVTHRAAGRARRLVPSSTRWSPGACLSASCQPRLRDDGRPSNFG